MSKDLTISNIERQNVLNNSLAVETISQQLSFEGMMFENEYKFTKSMIAEFYEIEERTIERYLEKYPEELIHNGYKLYKGKRLKDLRLQFAHVINVGSKTTQLGLFNFRSFLNIGMLLTESEKAKQVRSLILDIVRQDSNYIPAAMAEENYRKNFTSAISRYIDAHTTNKYAQATDMIYKAVFKENAREYKAILKLDNTDKPRHTMYAEVLLAISSFENGVAYEIKQSAEKLGRKLSIDEVQQVINDLANHPLQIPYLNDARTKMASRDLGFRDVYHGNIAEYLKAVTPEEFERFIGSQSVDFDKILEDNQDTLKRLKQAEDE